MPPLEKFRSNQVAFGLSNIEIEIQYENCEKKWLFDDALTLIGKIKSKYLVCNEN